jgi:hypothetical protein
MPLGVIPALYFSCLHNACANSWGKSDTNISVNDVWSVAPDVLMMMIMAVRTFEIISEEFNVV